MLFIRKIFLFIMFVSCANPLVGMDEVQVQNFFPQPGKLFVYSVGRDGQASDDFLILDGNESDISEHSTSFDSDEFSFVNELDTYDRDFVILFNGDDWRCGGHEKARDLLQKIIKTMKHTFWLGRMNRNRRVSWLKCDARLEVEALLRALSLRDSRRAVYLCKNIFKDWQKKDWCRLQGCILAMLGSAGETVITLGSLWSGFFAWKLEGSPYSYVIGCTLFFAGNVFLAVAIGASIVGLIQLQTSVKATTPNLQRFIPEESFEERWPRLAKFCNFIRGFCCCGARGD